MRTNHLVAASVGYWIALGLAKLSAPIAALSRLQDTPEGSSTASFGFENGALNGSIVQLGEPVWSASVSILALALWVALPPLLLLALWIWARPARTVLPSQSLQSSNTRDNEQLGAGDAFPQSRADVNPPRDVIRDRNKL